MLSKKKNNASQSIIGQLCLFVLLFDYTITGYNAPIHTISRFGNHGFIGLNCISQTVISFVQGPFLEVSVSQAVFAEETAETFFNPKH